MATRGRHTQQTLPSTTDSVPLALTRAREAVMRPIREMLAASGLTEQQWRILRVLDEAGPLDASTLAERAALLLPSQTRIVQTLVAKKLVSRRADRRDRRRYRVAITAAGRQLIERNRDGALAQARRIEQGLGPARHRQLLSLLKALEEL